MRICLEKGYLAGFLNMYRHEAVTMLSELFDEKALREQYDIALAAESETRGEAQD